jgi:protein-L-isoaspartate(D-aspartate) O-methyltransferase
MKLPGANFNKLFLLLLAALANLPVMRAQMDLLVSTLKARGVIQSERVAAAMLQVDRGEFCTESPYEDRPSLIGSNATISAPHMHAYALEASLPALRPGAKVLDVGSGSGYLSVCYAELVKPGGRVVGIEHIDALVNASIRSTEKSHKDLLESGLLKFVVGDGRQGYPAEAPYDVIHVGAASEEVPSALIAQLAPGGILIIPVGGEEGQVIRVISKDAHGNTGSKDILPVRYVPLTDKSAQLRYRYI